MSSGDPFSVPPGWRRSQREGVVAATRPGATPARLEWRTGPPPPYEALLLEDGDSVDLDGYRVDYRRFGHRAGGVEMLSEEWTWWVAGERVALTGTVSRDDYLSVCELFEDVAATVEPGLAPRWVGSSPDQTEVSPTARRRARSARA